MNPNIEISRRIDERNFVYTYNNKGAIQKIKISDFLRFRNLQDVAPMGSNPDGFVTVKTGGRGMTYLPYSDVVLWSKTGSWIETETSGDNIQLYGSFKLGVGSAVNYIENSLTNNAARLPTSAAVFAAITASSVAYGSSAEIPYMNVGGTAFTYNLGFAFGFIGSDATLALKSTTGNESAVALWSGASAGVMTYINTGSVFAVKDHSGATQFSIAFAGATQLFYNTGVTLATKSGGAHITGNLTFNAESEYITAVSGRIGIWHDMALFDTLNFTTTDLVTAGSGVVTGTTVRVTGSSTGVQLRHGATDRVTTSSSGATITGALTVTGATSTTSLTASGLIATRIPYVTTGGLLTSSGNLVYASNNFYLAGGTYVVSVNNTSGVLVRDSADSNNSRAAIGVSAANGGYFQAWDAAESSILLMRTFLSSNIGMYYNLSANGTYFLFGSSSIEKAALTSAIHLQIGNAAATGVTSGSLNLVGYQVGATQTIGQIWFQQGYSTVTDTYARIAQIVGATGAAGYNSGRLTFYTASAGTLAIDMYLENGNVYMPSLANSSGTNFVKFTAGGLLTQYATSDIRLKENIKLWEPDSLAFLEKQDLITYDMRDGSAMNQLGWNGTQMRELMPDMTWIDNKGYVSIKDGHSIFHLHRAIKQLAPLKAEVAQLKKEIAELKLKKAA